MDRSRVYIETNAKHLFQTEIAWRSLEAKIAEIESIDHPLFDVLDEEYPHNYLFSILDLKHPQSSTLIPDLDFGRGILVCDYDWYVVNMHPNAFQCTKGG